MSIFDIDWLSVWNTKKEVNFGSVIIPDNLNIPPSLANIIVSFSNQYSRKFTS